MGGSTAKLSLSLKADVKLLVNWLDHFPALVVVVLDDWHCIHMADPVVLERCIAEAIAQQRRYC
jgi:hypothetical protein